LAASIQEQLDAGKNVLWLVSGGSATHIAAEARNQVNIEELKRLHVCLVDERFVPVRDKNSNWERLASDGFDQMFTESHPIIKYNLDAQALTSDYNQLITDILKDKNLYVIGLFGIGADGHTAGLLPGNPVMDSGDYVATFKGDDFERITITPKMIERIDEAVVFSMGTTKYDAIQKFIDDDDSIIATQVLKKIKNIRLYTDKEWEDR